jgi:excisionase family DNA binding protein
MHALLVSITEAGRVIGVGRTTVYDLIRRGTLPAVHVGRRVLVPVDALEEYVARLRSDAGE